MKNLLVLLGIIVFSSCARTIQYTKFTDESKLDTIQNARVYLIRPSYLGGAIPMKVFCNGDLIGKTGPRGYLCWDVKAGTNLIQSNAENKEYFTVNAQKGKTYYIKQNTKFGWATVRVGLSASNETKVKKITKSAVKPKNNYLE